MHAKTATVALGAGDVDGELDRVHAATTARRRRQRRDTACDLLVRHDPSQPGAEPHSARQLAAFLHSVQDPQPK